jgi:glycerophosphoryl diester phosphodiesterase
MTTPVRIAHRGASGKGLAPENTLAAFDLALKIGVDALEIDVHATRDGQIVVVHDADLRRTTDRSGLVRELTLDQIREADAGGWFGASFRGERVPTLQEVLDLARNRALVLIEVKADFIAERTLQIIADAKAEAQVVLQSFNPETVRRIRRLDPGFPVAQLIGKLATRSPRLQARKLVRRILQDGANALAIWHGALSPAFFDEMRKRAISVWTWTVDEEETMRDLALLGVQGIITNYPNRLNRVLDDLIRDGLLQPPPGGRKPSAQSC